MFRDYRMGQRLSGATISDYCLRTGDYPATIPQDSATIVRSAATIPRLSGDYSSRISDYSATIRRLFQPNQRLFRDYWKRAARISGRRFLLWAS